MPDTSTPAVTAALQTALGSGYGTFCEPHSVDWACKVFPAQGACVNPTAATGSATVVSVASRPRVAATSVSARTLVSPTCAPGTRETKFEVGEAVDGHMQGVRELPSAPTALISCTFPEPKVSIWRKLFTLVGSTD